MSYPLAQPELNELRQTERHPIRFLRIVEPICGEVLDVSSRGLRVETTAQLGMGTERTLVLADSKGGERTVRARVRWSKLLRTYRTSRGETVPIYVSGVELSSQK